MQFIMVSAAIIWGGSAVVGLVVGACAITSRRVREGIFGAPAALQGAEQPGR